MSEPTKIPLGARVKFTAKLSIAGQPADPPDLSATITAGGVPETFTLKDRVERLEPGLYQLLYDVTKAGALVVRFSTKDGDTQKESYVVVDLAIEKQEQAAARARVLAVRGDVAWPPGFDRPRAIAELGLAATSTKSDAYLLGALLEKQKSARYDYLISHDDSRPLPGEHEDAARADVAGQVKRSTRFIDAKQQQKLLVDARRKVRTGLLSR